MSGESVVVAITNLFSINGLAPVGGKVAEYEFKHDGATWKIVINGKNENYLLPGGSELEPFWVYVERNEWPLGMINIVHGIGQFVAADGANKDTFIAACEAETEKLESGKKWTA